jgi:hypothetical protein
MRRFSRVEQVGDAIQAENLTIPFKAVPVTMKVCKYGTQSVDSELLLFEAEFVLFHENDPFEIEHVGPIVDLM